MTGIRLTTLLAVSASVLALAACGPDGVVSPGEGAFPPGGGGGGGGGGTPPPAPGTPAADCPTGFANVGLIASGTLRVCQLPGQIDGNLTVPLRAGTIYSISGRTSVGTDRGVDAAAPTPGSTSGILTIEAGVRLFASGGSDYLLVNRGSQLFAEGTESQPIIFTSRQNVEGTTNESSQGQWGGIVLAGRAPQANCANNGMALTLPITCTGTVEGTSAFYGGNTPTDNSGRLRYVQIKFSGFEISLGNELQGLTMAGVGSGTTVEFIHVHNSSDDGIEIFGGNVNLRRIVITGADDDGFDTDTGWRGAAQFGIVTQRAPTFPSRSAGFEFSSAGTGLVAARYVSRPKIANWTLVGRNAPADIHTVAHFDSGTQATIINSVFTNVAGSAASCLAIANPDEAATTVTFNSVYMSCGTPYRAANAVVSAARFTAGTNNTAAGTSTLVAPASGTSLSNQVLTFINGMNENAVTPVVASTVDPYFVNTSYIGAVQNASDTWWRGWTCGLTAGQTC